MDIERRRQEVRVSPNSDENKISLYIVTTCSNIQVMRMKEVITKLT